MGAARLSPELPEYLARLYNDQIGKFATPLDSQGIADIDKVFELALRTYPESLDSIDFDDRNIHHIYWTEAFWIALASSHPYPDSETIDDFRNSTPQRAYVPLPLHAWIEKVMIPPPPPPIEVMRRRNAAWSVAEILLKGAILLDQARNNYDEKKDTVRIVYGWFDGLTPLSQRGTKPVEERVNREYWLSELNARVKGWRRLSEFVINVPLEDRIISAARLAEVRGLNSRIKHGAIVPRVPTDLALSA